MSILTNAGFTAPKNFKLQTLNFEPGRRHRVMAATTPRPAAHQPPRPEQAAFDGTMRLDGFDGVLRTRRLETAAAQRARQAGQHG